jgi:hypothetical protein
MDFIDKLEKFLLTPKLFYYGIPSNKEFLLGGYKPNYYGRQKKEVKQDGIISMMKKLRDPSYQHPEYSSFSLDIIVSNLIDYDYFKDIMALEPTNDDLLNLYRITKDNRKNKLLFFLNIFKDKEYKLKLLKYGYNYDVLFSRDYKLKDYVNALKDLDIHDDEWIEVLSSYINNSIAIKEKEKKVDLIEVCIDCIKNTEKCEKFVKDFFNENINLSELIIENTVKQLRLDSRSIIKNFGYRDNHQVSWAIMVLHKLMSSNLSEIGSITRIDYYNIDTEYNFIIYCNSDDKGIEIIKVLIDEIMPILKDLKGSIELAATEFNKHFIAKLSYINLSRNIEINQTKKKIIKV